MKPRFPLGLFSLALVAAVTASDATAAPEAASALKQAFRYVQAQSRSTEGKPEADSPVVAMERFVVVAPALTRDQRAMIESHNKKIQDQGFSLTKGGALFRKDLGKARIEIGAWAAGPGLNFLQISW